jgi:hydroxymethylbilane synthase
MLIVGTRGSRLALAQTALVVDALKAAHPGMRFDVREITTQGDRDPKPLSVIGGQGVFTKAIEDALLAGTIDIAVHSMKDLPPRLTEGLVIAAVPDRADARDALVTKDGRKLADLAPGARIGTGSARRAVQLKAIRADVECVEIRGNVDTRIRKVDEGEYDGIVLAIAGLERLGLAARASQVFSTEEMVPSPGQGALAVQVRERDDHARSSVAAIDHRNTRIATKFERAFLEELGAGCTMPAGAHAGCEPSFWWLAMIGSQDGTIRRDGGAGVRVVTRYSLRHLWRTIARKPKDARDELFYLEEQMPRIAARVVGRLAVQADTAVA